MQRKFCDFHPRKIILIVRKKKIIFEEITNFNDKYKKIPTGHALEIEVGERKV